MIFVIGGAAALSLETEVVLRWRNCKEHFYFEFEEFEFHFLKVEFSLKYNSTGIDFYFKTLY